MKKRLYLLIAALLLLGGFCFMAAILFGSGLTALWLGLEQAAAPSPTSRPTRRPTATATLTLTSTSTPTLTPTPTLTLLPTATSTSTPVPPSPTSTPAPPTATSTPRPPTATPPPTVIPTPNFAFAVAEKAQFPTSHPDFDVYIAITDAHNTPLSGYRVIGRHSGGTGEQIDSAASAGTWTENSGAKHYKAGNIKYHVPNSAGGVWTLQLVDGAGQPAAPPVDCPFDPASPGWYFVLYRLAK